MRYGIRLTKSQINIFKWLYNCSRFGYCYHSFNVISLTLHQSDHIKRSTLFTRKEHLEVKTVTRLPITFLPLEVRIVGLTIGTKKKQIIGQIFCGVKFGDVDVRVCWSKFWVIGRSQNNWNYWKRHYLKKSVQ